MSGHIFIVHGDITQLAAHAIAYSTSTALDTTGHLYSSFQKHLPDFIKQFQPGYPVGFNQRPEVLEYLQHPVMYQLMMPQVAVIDRKGMIRAQFAGSDKFFDKPEQEKNFRALLEPLLKEGAAAETHRKTGGKKKS